jgi:para-aminobenzoate synthetase component 1
MNALLPSLDAARESFVPLVEELTPTPEPWDVARRLAHLNRLLFLDSAQTHPGFGRYSFVTADPFEWLWARGQRIVASGKRCQAGDPFAMLADRLARFPAATIPGLPPFQGGIAGLFGYDLCHHLERLPRPSYDEFETPDLAVGLYDWVIAFDHAENRAWLISTGVPGTEPRRRHFFAARRLKDVRLQLRSGPRSYEVPKTSDVSPRLRLNQLAPRWPVPHLPGLMSNFNRPAYLETIRRAIEYTHAGDCFQVNIAQRLLYPAPEHPLELYRRLRERNAAPFAAFLDLGDFVVASASPERFLRVASAGHQRPDDVDTYPIKGTRPRGTTPQEEQALVSELATSVKDCAENVMIVDLMRNDLGRVCAYGSIEVPAVCRVETFRYVHHLVSEVRGRLRSGMGPIDLLRAAFPGGSVTGAPKVRAMEIIAELEPTARGPYCGSLGYIGFDGSMDTNMLIRTFTIGRGWAQFPVGGGIVADSVPEREYEETWHKAEGLLQALR